MSIVERLKIADAKIESAVGNEYYKATFEKQIQELRVFAAISDFESASDVFVPIAKSLIDLRLYSILKELTGIMIVFKTISAE